MKKNVNKKICKGIGITLLSGTLLLAPAIGIGLAGSQTFVKNQNQDAPSDNEGTVNQPTDKPDKPIIPPMPERIIQIWDNVDLVVPFDDIFKGFDKNYNVTESVQKILNKDESKKRMIINYEDFSEDQKQRMKLTIPDVNNGNKQWGTKKYNDWKSDTTNAIVNNFNDFIKISSLSELKQKINNEDMLKKLLKSASIDSNNFTNLKIVENTNIGIERNTNNSIKPYQNLIHINVQANDNTKTLMKYDLGIPISNINYELKDLKITSYLDGDAFIKKTCIKMDFGINPVIKNFNSKEIVIDSQKQQKSVVEVSEIINGLNWNNITPNQKMSSNKMELNSDKIGKELGIYNVTFSNPTDTTPNDKKIGMDSYNGMSLTFDITPNENFYWQDGTNETKKITLSNLQVKIKDSRVCPWCRVNRDDRYGLVWKDMYPDKENDFPDTLEKVKNILEDDKKFQEFWSVAFNVKKYKNDFSSVKMDLVQNSITWKKCANKNSIYWFEVNFKPLQGHELIDQQESGETGEGTLPLNTKLFFRIQLNPDPKKQNNIPFVIPNNLV